MLQYMSSRQLTELEAFWQHEQGWGDYKRDYHFGQLCAIIAESNRDRKKRSTPFSIHDFNMRSDTRPKKRDEKSIRATLDALSKVKVGKHGRRRKSRNISKAKR